MAISVVMPALEMAQETGKLLAWRKQEGERVVKGEPLLEIETDKVVLDIEAPADGILAGVTQRDGAVVPVGEIIGWIVAPGEQPPADSGPGAVSARATQEQARPMHSAAPGQASSPPSSPDGAANVSPKARRMAQEHGVDLTRVRGTGPNGAITGDDVLAAVQQVAATPASPAQPPAGVAAKASPKARRMAEEHGVDLTRVRGTGPNGTISGDDVLAAAQQAAVTPVPPVQPPADVAAKASPKARRIAEEHGVDLSRVLGTGPNGTITGDDVLAAAQQAAATLVPPVQPPPDFGAKASPKARRIAEEHGVDLSRVLGTGPNGAVTGEDVLAAAQKATAAVQAPAPLSAIARLMAERTAHAWATVPHFFLTREIDAGALVEARDEQARKIAASGGVRPTHTDLLIAIVARVLVKHPKMNASWTGSAIRLNPNVNISLAIAVKDGVVGAVIPNADRANLSAIATRRRDIAVRAKAGRLHPPDIEGGTFTISNLGMYNVDAFQAIITPPQAAILAVGRIADRVVALNGAHAIRPRLTVTLSSDHRVVDGAQAALFLNDLVQALEDPQKLLA